MVVLASPGNLVICSATSGFFVLLDTEYNVIFFYFEGYEGSQCEVNVDACNMFGNDTVCLNGATCVDSDVGLDWSCLCVAGFTGG